MRLVTILHWSHHYSCHTAHVQWPQTCLNVKDGGPGSRRVSKLLLSTVFLSEAGTLQIQDEALSECSSNSVSALFHTASICHFAWVSIVIQQEPWDRPVILWCKQVFVDNANDNSSRARQLVFTVLYSRKKLVAWIFWYFAWHASGQRSGQNCGSSSFSWCWPVSTICLYWPIPRITAVSAARRLTDVCHVVKHERLRMTSLQCWMWRWSARWQTHVLRRRSGTIEDGRKVVISSINVMHRSFTRFNQLQ